MNITTNTRKRRIVTLAIAVAAALIVALGEAALASSVTTPNTFTPGTTAQASQVNANFSAIQTAVNDNASRITTLEGQKRIVSKAFATGWGSQPGSTGADLFVSPTVSVTIAAGQQLEVTVSESLGVSTTASTMSFGICYQQGTGTVTRFETGYAQTATIPPGYTHLSTFTLASPAAGTYSVGMCGSSTTPANIDLAGAGRVIATVYQ